MLWNTTLDQPWIQRWNTMTWIPTLDQPWMLPCDTMGKICKIASVR